MFLLIESLEMSFIFSLLYDDELVKFQPIISESTKTEPNEKWDSLILGGNDYAQSNTASARVEWGVSVHIAFCRSGAMFSLI